MSHIKKYKVGEIKGILEKIYNNSELRRNVVPLFMSDSGLGKTYIIEEFMKEKGVYKPPFVLSQRMPFEVSGMAMVDKDIDRMKYYDFDFLLDLKDGDILFIDETYNANPNTLSAFLTFLESRIMISGKELPDIMIVAAANPQGMPILTPQIKRRFLQYDIEFDSNSFNTFMYNKYELIKPISNKLCRLIKDEDFTGYNFNTPADLDKAVGMIINDVPTPYETEIKPILSTIIENKLGGKVEDKGLTVESNEKITWLDLIRSDKEIRLEGPAKEEVTSNTDEILILNKDKEEIGSIKDIEALKMMYHFDTDDIIDLEKGKAVYSSSRLTSFQGKCCFFQKKINK